VIDLASLRDLWDRLADEPKVWALSPTAMREIRKLNGDPIGYSNRDHYGPLARTDETTIAPAWVGGWVRM
jgi:hypothetical protein